MGEISQSQSHPIAADVAQDLNLPLERVQHYNRVDQAKPL
jgi:hypothetical protein